MRTPPDSAPMKTLLAALLIVPWLVVPSLAQSVCLPAPRLLNLFPAGCQAGTTVEVLVSGENLDEISELIFSDSRITAERIENRDLPGAAVRYAITVPEDVAPGLVEAYAIARLGVSSSRVFSIGALPEITQTTVSSSADQAMTIPLDTTINAQMITRGIQHYRFPALAGQRLRVDCVSRGIDSKADPVLILTSADGRVLASDRIGNGLDFVAPQAEEFILKVHEMTYQGGPEFFYRLTVQALDADSAPHSFATTREVHQYSWPPADFRPRLSESEQEPNDPSQPQPIELPCQISGSFYPAADVDCFQFSALAGQQWWIEIASQRLGAPTAVAAFVQQRLDGDDGEVTWGDMLELKDIPPPIKVSTNHYAYDGPPYNGGSTDLLGRLDIPADGIYRLQLNDLFGGTRDDPQSVYQLMIRPAMPDFALTGWVKHMALRNGDRNALSKPLALRPGTTLAIEIGVFRRDGFDLPIQLDVGGLPTGVTASAIDIPAGQTAGTMLLTVAAGAPPSLSFVALFGSAETDNGTLVRPVQMASMEWPVRDHWREFPRARLSQRIPLSVTASEPSPITIGVSADAEEPSVITATAGSTVTIPLRIERRCEYSGSVLTLHTLGSGFTANPRFDIPFQEDHAEVQLNLERLNVAPGRHLLAFYGAAVAKYTDYPAAVALATTAQQAAQQRVADLKQQLQEWDETTADGNAASERAELQTLIQDAEAAVKAAQQQVQSATTRSQPKDIADIVVTEPIVLEVVPAEPNP